jgi:hypothetical protein
MNLGQGSFRLFIVVFLGWTVFCGLNVAYREYARTDRDYAATCQIRKQTVAQFDLQKCLDDPAAASLKRDQTIEAASNWFVNGGYLFWLLPPFLITALAVIAIAAGAFVYRGFVAD